MNTVLLWGSAFDKKYKTNQWITYKQAEKEGGNIKRGEKATLVTLWKSFEKENKKTGETETKMFCAYHYVFNLNQTEGLNHLFKKPEIEGKKIKDIKKAEDFYKAIKSSKKLNIIHKPSDRAFYRPSDDIVLMPEKSQFKSSEKYYQTLFHELCHWTGHKTRLNRKYGNQFISPEIYAFEELVAEIGASFVCGFLSIPYETQHSTYIKSWIKYLSEDSRAIFRAASQAQKACDYLLLAGGLKSQAKSPAKLKTKPKAKQARKSS